MNSCNRKEADYLRELAARVGEIARGNENASTKKRWRDVNALKWAMPTTQKFIKPISL